MTQDLKAKAENLFNELAAHLRQAEEIDKKQATLEQYERDLRTLEKSVDSKRNQLAKEKQALQAEKDYLTQANKELKTRELRLVQEANKLANIQAEEYKLDQRRIELQQEMDKLEEKKRSLTKLEEREQEIDKKQALLTKEIAVDRKRKEILDLRETRIKARETQLQIESEV